MKDIPIGDFIRQRRQALGLSQAQVCEGLCEPATLSRIENGSQAPSYRRAIALLQRLGLSDDLYFALVDRDEMAVQTLREEVLADAIRFKRAGDEERPQIQASALEKLAELEQAAKPDDRITRQFILSTRAAIGSYSPQEQRELVMEALRLTVPRIDLENIQPGLYSMDETTLLNQIAVTYATGGNRRKAIDIYRQLLRYVQKNHRELSRYAGHFSLIAHNYSRELLLEKRYEEAVEVAELGRKTCVEYGHYQFLPGILDILGCCYYYTGDQEKCREYYRCAYYLYKAIGNEHDRLLLEKAAQEQLGPGFSF